jgi:hypothetical protein
MRKYLILAVVALVAMVVPSLASAQEQQSLVVKVTPTKLDKKKFKPATIFVDVITANNDQAGQNPDQPPSADRTRVDFSPNMKFTPSAVPTCEATEAQLQNTTTEQATELCGKDSIVSVAGDGKTEATVLVDPNPAVNGSAPIVVDVVVTAFNGFEKDTLFLHARADAVRNTSVLVGKLTAGPSGFGRTLDVTIPDLLAGAISDFKTTVKAGKYVQSRCKDKTPTYQARTEYENHAPTTATAQDKCTQKKKKKK